MPSEGAHSLAGSFACLLPPLLFFMKQNSNCTLCPLHKEAQSVCIPGRGDEKPKYLFVGQAPGQEEDQRNKVFIGPSGQLLLEGIKQYALLPARLSNVVRCYPPHDREPTKNEIEACKPYIISEMEETKPKIIVACGNAALKALTGKHGIMKHAGSVVGEINGAPVFAMLHPSYILRYPKDAHKWEMQFKALKNLGEGVEKKKAEFEIVTPGKMYDILWARVKAETKGFVTFDFETTGAYKQFGGALRCIGIHVDGKNYIVDALAYDFDTLMKFFAKEPMIKKCAHNSIFERRWIRDEFGVETANLAYDTMLLHYLMDENKPHGLDMVAFEHLGVEGWDIERRMQENSWTWATVPFEILAEYCAMDVEVTHKLMEHFIQILKAEPRYEKTLELYQKVLLPISAVCASMESRGMKIDKDWAKLVSEEYELEGLEIFSKMKERPEVKKYLKDHKIFNPASSKQVGEILYNVLKLKAPKKTKKGADSSNSESLELLKDKSPFASLVLDYREKETLQGNFLQKFPEMTDLDGLIHPSFSPAFQVTGRISVRKPPAANMPRDPRVRGMVVSRFAGGSILSPDYKQLEMRLVASEAQEETMLKIFSEGKDVHDETTKAMFGEDFTKAQRDIAKNINFGTVYGISPWSLSLKFSIPIEKAEEWIEKHRETYPKIYSWMEEQHRFMVKNGWIASRFGRVRHLPEILGLDESDYEENKLIQRILRQTGNFGIQAQGADITSLASIRVNYLLESRSLKSLMILQPHDAFVIDTYPGEEETLSQICRKVMEVEVPKQCSWLRVPLPVDIKISQRWGGAQ